MRIQRGGEQNISVECKFGGSAICDGSDHEDEPCDCVCHEAPISNIRSMNAMKRWHDLLYIYLIHTTHPMDFDHYTRTRMLREYGVPSDVVDGERTVTEAAKVDFLPWPVPGRTV